MPAISKRAAATSDVTLTGRPTTTRGDGLSGEYRAAAAVIRGTM